MTCGGERENFLLSSIFFAVSTHCDLKLIDRLTQISGLSFVPAVPEEFKV